MKVPSTNIQAPEKHQAPNINPFAAPFVGGLKFGASLDVGAWGLEL
jgi:hypothetical protein